MTVTLKSVIQDIVKTTSAIGFESIKVTISDKGAAIEAFNNAKTVIMKANTKSPVQGIADGTFGLVNLDMLKGYVSTFSSDESVWTLKTIKKGEVDVPESIQFDSTKGASAAYRLASLTPPQPKFTGVNYDVVLENPSRAKVNEFAALAGILSSVETKFVPRTKKNALVFLLGEENSSTDHAEVLIADAVKGDLKGQFHWPVQETLTILKADASKTTISIADAGMMTVRLETGVSNYEFHLPGHN